MRTHRLVAPLLRRKPTQQPTAGTLAPDTLPLLAVQAQHADPWPSLWWLGVHGGAAVTTLQAGTGLGADAQRAWPQPPDGLTAHVVLVARASAAGLHAASAALAQTQQHGQLPTGIRLVGVAVVAAGPGRVPRLVSDRIALLSAWTRVWSIGWHEAYLAATTPADVATAPPDLARLTHQVSAALQEEHQPLERIRA